MISSYEELVKLLLKTGIKAMRYLMSSGSLPT